MSPDLREAVEALAKAVGGDTSEGFIWHRSGRGYWELHCLYQTTGDSRGYVREVSFIAHMYPWSESTRYDRRWFPYAPAEVSEDPLIAAHQLLEAQVDYAGEHLVNVRASGWATSTRS